MKKRLGLTDAERIVKKLIADYFPELRTTKLILQTELSDKNYYMAVKLKCSRRKPYTYIIFIDRLAFCFSEKAFIGCMAHELGHIIELEKLNSTGLIKDFFLSILSKKYQIQQERKIDQAILQKGLGEALLQFHKEHEKEYEKYDDEDGLTKRAIKLYLQKNKNTININSHGEY